MAVKCRQSVSAVKLISRVIKSKKKLSGKSEKECDMKAEISSIQCFTTDESVSGKWRKQKSVIKSMLTFTCIFTCRHIHTLSVKINSSSDLIPESFNKCNCKINGDKRALWAYFRSNACWVNLMWTFSACTWHQISLHSTKPLLSCSPALLLQVSTVALCCNGFYIHLHLMDPSFMYSIITVIHFCFSPLFYWLHSKPDTAKGDCNRKQLSDD